VAVRKSVEKEEGGGEREKGREKLSRGFEIPAEPGVKTAEKARKSPRSRCRESRVLVRGGWRGSEGEGRSWGTAGHV